MTSLRGRGKISLSLGHRSQIQNPQNINQNDYGFSCEVTQVGTYITYLSEEAYRCNNNINQIICIAPFLKNVTSTTLYKYYLQGFLLCLSLCYSQYLDKFNHALCYFFPAPLHNRFIYGQQQERVSEKYMCSVPEVISYKNGASIFSISFP